MPAGSPSDAEARIRQTLLSQGKIAAVKLCRDLQPGLGLADAKARVDRLEAGLPAATSPRTGAGCLMIAMTLALMAGGGACVLIARFG